LRNTQNEEVSVESIPPEIDIFAIDHGYPFAHFFLNNPEVMLICGRNKWSAEPVLFWRAYQQRRLRL